MICCIARVCDLCHNYISNWELINVEHALGQDWVQMVVKRFYCTLWIICTYGMPEHATCMNTVLTVIYSSVWRGLENGGASVVLVEVCSHHREQVGSCGGEGWVAMVES